MTINHSREVGDQVGDLRVLSVTVLPEWAKSWMGEKASRLHYVKLGPAWFSGLNSNRRVSAPNPAAGSQISYHLERVCFVIEISSAVGLLVVVAFSFSFWFWGLHLTVHRACSWLESFWCPNFKVSTIQSIPRRLQPLAEVNFGEGQ